MYKLPRMFMQKASQPGNELPLAVSPTFAVHASLDLMKNFITHSVLSGILFELSGCRGLLDLQTKGRNGNLMRKFSLPFYSFQNN